MRTIIRYILAIFLITVIFAVSIYAFAAFYHGSFNPMEWSETSRYAVVCSPGLALIAVVLGVLGEIIEY